MKNLYEALHLASTATAEDIRKAYKKHALFCHPDKGGSHEKMQALNQAYKTLIDPIKRKTFDQEWEAFKSFDEDTSVGNTSNLIYLDQTQSVPFSAEFKAHYATFLATFTLKPRHRSKASDQFKPIPSSAEESQDLSEFLVSVQDCLSQVLSPEVAISMLLHRLHGRVTPKMTQVVIDRCHKVPANPYHLLETQLYEGIAIFLTSIDKKDCSQDLLPSLEKITQYAFSRSPMPRIVTVLLQDHAFRLYFKQALEQCWLKPNTLSLTSFNGKKTLKTLIKKLKETGYSQKSLLSLLKLFHQFEKGLSESDTKAVKTYREEAYTILDWIPVFSEKAGFSVVLNALLQAGVSFQCASTRETNTLEQMADEALAQELYLLAFSMAQRATPDMTLYIGTHVLRHLALFRYPDESFSDVIEGIQHRVFQLADIFPLYRPLQSSVDLLFHSEEKALHGMRDYLHALMEIVEYNQLSDEPLRIDHRPVTVLYQAYEASLKNWYTDQHDAAEENRLRLNLMCELLEANDWNFDQITHQVDFSWQVDRDQDGWLCPKESLNLGKTKEAEIFKSIEGLKVDYQQGNIEFVTTPWHAKDDEGWQRLVTLSDLHEMLATGMDGAFFSLDPVDPALPYHPFNAMRFAPSQLYETEFLKSMLLADYLLKFLTMKQEVQGQFPYQTRSIDTLLSHVPEVFVQFIRDFHPSAERESLHRFWIEAREVPAATYEFENDKEDFHCFAFPEIEMVVKKHLMVRDSHGNLVDADESQEGWHFYDLNDQQREEVRQGKRKLDMPALIFNQHSPTVYFYDNQTLSEALTLENFDAQLKQLSQEVKDAHQKINRNDNNEAFLYFVTNTVTEKGHQPHHFSPEYIFAQEFTDRYDTLAVYFPELGRLRELSRFTVLIRFLKNIRQNNTSTLNILETLLNNTTHWTERDKEIQREIKTLQDNYQKEFQKHRERVATDLGKQFAEWRQLLRSLSLAQSQIAREAIITSFKESPIDRYTICQALWWQGYGAAEANIVTQMTNHALRSYQSQVDEAVTTLKKIIPTEKGALERKLKGRVALEKQLKSMGLKDEEKSIPLEKKCLWVPANIQHRFYKNGEHSHSQTTYGGVYVQPQVKLLQQNSGPYHAALGAVFQGTQQARISSQQIAQANQTGFNRQAITRGFQDHHIISNKHRDTKSHELLEQANFNLENRANKVYLPTKAENHPTRSIHLGRHLNSVSDTIARKMDRAASRGRKENWTTEQYNQAVKKILKEERVELKAGNIALNKHKRPWAN